VTEPLQFVVLVRNQAATRRANVAVDGEGARVRSLDRRALIGLTIAAIVCAVGFEPSWLCSALPFVLVLAFPVSALVAWCRRASTHDERGGQRNADFEALRAEIARLRSETGSRTAPE
jgi:hypothetical protein